jgi:hypothetical protein
MDASQYKDNVLFMLFIKYISDKYADYDGFEPPVIIPEGAGFKDMLSQHCPAWQEARLELNELPVAGFSV